MLFFYTAEAREVCLPSMWNNRFDTKKLKMQVQKGVVGVSEFYERYLLTEGQ